jgi:hypothetical protein
MAGRSFQLACFGRRALISILVLLATSTSPGEVIWDNGLYATSGMVVSIGWNQSMFTPYRTAMTDDFVLDSPAILTRLTAYGFMPGNFWNQPQVVDMYVRILADNNGQPGQPILGSFVTYVPFTETFTGSYFSTYIDAPIYRLEADLPDWRLCPGRYWVQYNVDQSDTTPSSGTLNSYFYTPLVQPPPPPPTGWGYNVLQGIYYHLENNGSPFTIEGTLLEVCVDLGDFDGDAQCTIADIPDFVAALLTSDFVHCADLNSDCQADGRDVATFIARLGG